MFFRRVGIVMVIGIGIGSDLNAQSFTLKQGANTVATENFTRTAKRVDGELRVMGAPRIKYSLELDNNGLPVTLTNTVYQPTNSDAVLEAAVLHFRADSMIADIDRGGAKRREALKREPGSFPFINPSFAFTEAMLADARKRNSVPARVTMFSVAGGGTSVLEIKWVQPDSAILGLDGIAVHLKVDADNRILGGAIPMQGVTIVRSEGRAEFKTTKTDYSAPANASFTAEDVVIPTKGGFNLGGTLTLPRNVKHPPVVVTISGSGMQDRDEWVAMLKSYRPFRQYAESFAAQGIAVLRYDDRGLGESGGNVTEATSQDFANDTRAVIDYLRTRTDVDADKIFLLGHSEGGIIAPMLAATDDKLAGIILMAGTAYNGRRILDYQYAGSGVSVDSVVTRNEWLKYFATYEPLSAAKLVRKVPVLIVQGDQDKQVTAEQAPILEKTFRAAGNKDVTIHVLPGVNHLFLSDPTGTTPYAQLPDQKVPANIIALMADWIVKHAK